MKVLIDTCLPDLFLSIVKDDVTIAFIHKKDLVKKADELAKCFDELLAKANAKIKDIKEFYVTIGPGSFMGCRTALIFAKTICMITKAKLFTESSFVLPSKNIDGTYFIDAKGNQFYKALIARGNKTFSLENSGLVSQIDYEEIIAKPNAYLSLFNECNDLLSLDAFYLKEPRVGGE